MDMSPEQMRKAMKLAQAMGRGEDTILAHITPDEAALLKMRGGRGSTNPVTGLLEFGASDAGDWAGSAGPGDGPGGGGNGNDDGASLDGMGNYGMGGPGRGTSATDDGMESPGMGPGNYGGRKSSDWNFGPQEGSPFENFLSSPTKFIADAVVRNAGAIGSLAGFGLAGPLGAAIGHAAGKYFGENTGVMEAGLGAIGGLAGGALGSGVGLGVTGGLAGGLAGGAMGHRMDGPGEIAGLGTIGDLAGLSTSTWFGNPSDDQIDDKFGSPRSVSSQSSSGKATGANAGEAYAGAGEDESDEGGDTSALVQALMAPIPGPSYRPRSFVSIPRLGG